MTRELKYSIPKDDAKRLIGPGGANIKRLRLQSGALIKIDNTDLPAGPEHPPGTEVCHSIAIAGKETQVQAAVALIGELLAMSPTETLLGGAAPPAALGPLPPMPVQLPVHAPLQVHVPRGIPHAQAEYMLHARTPMPVPGPAPLPPTMVSTAVAPPGLSAATRREEKYSMPKDDAKRLIGPGGSNIKRIREHSGAVIKIDNVELQALPEHPPGTGVCNSITIVGTEPQMTAALHLISELLSTPPSETLHGGRAASASQLQQAHLQHAQVLQAQMMHAQQMQGQQYAQQLHAQLPMPSTQGMGMLLPQHPMGTTSLPAGDVKYSIPKDDVKRLIGPGGANIKRLRLQSGAMIKIDNNDMPAGPEHPPGTGSCNMITVVGTEPQVSAAVQLISELIAAPPSETLHGGRM